MQCQQCGYAMSAFDVVCPRCAWKPGTPIYTPPQQSQTPPYQQPAQPQLMTTTPGQAAKAGFFGAMGVWFFTCVLPLAGCFLVVVIMAILGAIGASTSPHSP